MKRKQKPAKQPRHLSEEEQMEAERLEAQFEDELMEMSFQLRKQPQ